MAVDISEYLDAIAGDSDGEEVIQAIHDASLAIGIDMHKTADIDELLENIKTKIFGIEIRMDIYEILKRLSEAEPGPTPTPSSNSSVVFGNPIVVDNGYGHYLKPEPTPFFESI